MDKINADHDLSALQVFSFDGLPGNYPMFRKRFLSHQMMESKTLEEPTKMARLLPFLDGLVLLSVQRYETVPERLNEATPGSSRLLSSIL